MSMVKTTKIMIGYDISPLTSYIRELENSDDNFCDGIPEYSLNYSNNEIGYCGASRKFFGQTLAYADDLDGDEDGLLTKFDLSELQEMENAIWEKYKLFLFDYTKLTDKTKPKLQIGLVTYYS